MAGTGVPCPTVTTVTNTATTTVVQVWDKGTLSICLSQPNPCHPHHPEQGALLCHHRGTGQPCKGHPLPPGTWVAGAPLPLVHQGHRGTGIPGHWS